MHERGEAKCSPISFLPKPKQTPSALPITFIEEKKQKMFGSIGGIGGSIDPFGRRTSSSDTWLPERRARYNAKRRQKDLELIFSIWNEALPNANDAVVHIADAPANVVKKHKRAVNAHREDLVRIDGEWQEEWRPYVEVDGHAVLGKDGSITRSSCDKMAPHSFKMLRLFKERIPTHKSKVISDLPINFRDIYDGWYDEGDKGITTLHFWMNYRIGNSLILDEDFESGLDYIDRALSLIPPLRGGEIPHENEVMARIFRAMALQNLGDISGALDEYRVCLAAIRLLDYHGKVDMNDSEHILINKTTNFTSIIIGLTIERKIQEGATRPYFSHDDRLDLMKELGYGMYSDNSLKCGCCEKTDLELAKLKKKLVLCANCKGVWYCGRECQKEAWKKGGHSKICGKTTGVQTKQVSITSYAQLISGGLCFYRDKHDPSILVFFKDESTDQTFDALTDQEYEIEVDESGDTAQLTEYYHHSMYTDLIGERETMDKIIGGMKL